MYKKQFIKHTRLPAGCVCLFFILASCSVSKKRQPIEGVRFTQLWPNVSMEGKLVDYDTVYDYVYHYKNQVIYNASYVYRLRVNGKVVVEPERRYYYFVYTQGNPYGHLFDTTEKYYAKKLPVDSMLNSISAYLGVKNNSFLIFSGLISENFNKDSGTLIRTYAIKGTGKDSTHSGIQTLYYSNKFTDLQYSMSTQFDTVKGVKLYKSYMINNSRYLPDYKITIDRIDQTFFMDRLAIDNEKELMKYFEEDEKLNRNNK